MTQLPLEDRHPATRQLMRWLTPNPQLHGTSQQVSGLIHLTALNLLEQLGDGPELTAGLRKLLEAKDCCVRQAISDHGSGPQKILGDKE